MDGEIVERKPGLRCVRYGDLGVWERDPDATQLPDPRHDPGLRLPPGCSGVLTPASLIPITARPADVVGAAVEIVEQYSRRIGFDLDELGTS